MSAGLFSEDRLVLATTNADMEEAIDEIEIDYKGEPMEIIFNISYLLDMLAVVKTEKIRFSLSGPLSSGLVRVPDSEKLQVCRHASQDLMQYK